MGRTDSSASLFDRKLRQSKQSDSRHSAALLGTAKSHNRGDDLTERRVSRVPFAAVTRPFPLGTIRHDLISVSGEDRAAARTLKHSFFVENLPRGNDSFEERHSYDTRPSVGNSEMNLEKSREALQEDSVFLHYALYTDSSGIHFLPTESQLL